MLRFTQINGPVSGRIKCTFAIRQGGNDLYGCPWLVTVKHRAVYQGATEVSLTPKGSAFDVRSLWSKCRVLIKGSGFCRRYPAPNR